MLDMKEFDEDVYNMVKNFKFKKVHSKLQEQLRQDVKRITSSNKVFIIADKTQNYYELTKEDHDEILLENVTKTYQKADKSLPNRINTEAKSIAKSFEVDDKLEKISEQQAFFTIRDHKEDFRTNPKYLLNA